MELNIKYNINESLLCILIEAGPHTKQEVWSNLQDMTQKCFDRLIKSGNSTTWTKVKYPGTNAQLRISISRSEVWGLEDHEIAELKTITGEVSIKLYGKCTYFSSKQVEEFLVEKILLGAK